jgi:hypothetical protein
MLFGQVLVPAHEAFVRALATVARLCAIDVEVVAEDRAPLRELDAPSLNGRRRRS